MVACLYMCDFTWLQGSRMAIILMMVHVNHCPSLIISTWCGPLVLSFQVSPSPWANQHSTYMYNLPCRNIIHSCTITDSREKNIHGSDSSSYCSLLWTVIPLPGQVSVQIELFYTRLQSLKSTSFHTHVKPTLCAHKFDHIFIFSYHCILSFLDLMPGCFSKKHNTYLWNYITITYVRIRLHM